MADWLPYRQNDDSWNFTTVADQFPVVLTAFRQLEIKWSDDINEQNSEAIKGAISFRRRDKTGQFVLSVGDAREDPNRDRARERRNLRGI